jgi:hypothetical protein
VLWHVCVRKRPRAHGRNWPSVNKTEQRHDPSSVLHYEAGKLRISCGETAKAATTGSLVVSLLPARVNPCVVRLWPLCMHLLLRHKAGDCRRGEHGVGR